MDFNKYADQYRERVEETLSFSGQGQGFFLRIKAGFLHKLVARYFEGGDDLSFLDLGCGVGSMAGLLEGGNYRLFGVDIATESVKRAKRRVLGAHFAVYDGAELPFSEEQFDLVFAVCVVHHVDPAAWSTFFREMSRVVRPGGLAVIFEHNPLNPLTRLVVSRCEFDQDAVLLSARRVTHLLRSVNMEVVRTQNILFFPWEGRMWRRLEVALKAVPLGAQYFVTAKKRGEGS